MNKYYIEISKKNVDKAMNIINFYDGKGIIVDEEVWAFRCNRVIEIEIDAGGMKNVYSCLKEQGIRTYRTKVA